MFEKRIATKRGRQKQRTSSLVKSSYGRRLRAEQLEDRRMLATFTVSNLDDAGAGSLRDAITLANNTSGADEIAFDVGVTGAIDLASSLPTITDAVSINGPGAKLLAIDAGNGTDGVFNTGDGFRILRVNTGIDVSISGLTLRGGDPISGLRGGAIESFGNLTITASTIVGNAALRGGGIFSGGTLNIVNSTMSGNDASDFGAALLQTGGGVATVINSTFTGQTSSEAIVGTGGAILHVSSSTIAHNHSSGIRLTSTTTAQINNSIVTDQISAPSGVVSGDYNLFETGVSTTGGANDIVTGVAMLGPLADNGGPTLTLALLPGSPAIDAGNSVLTTDQRGFARPVDSPQVENASGSNGSDIGAIEFQELPSLVVTTSADVADAFDDQTSLREAIHFANSQAGADTITFSPLFDSAQAIDLASQLPTIIDAVTITGPGAELLAIQAGTGYRHLNLDDGDGNNQIDVSISGLTLTGGDTSENGGAILNRENLTVDSSVITGNQAFWGGGVYNSGALAVTDSTFSGNGAESGAGIRSSGDLSIFRSTLTDNTATNVGGAISSITNDAFTRRTTITDSTISGNSATFGGGGLFNSGGLTVITQSTITANTGQAGRASGVASRGDNTTRTEIGGSIIAGNSGGDVAVVTLSQNNSFQSQGFNLIGFGSGLIDPIPAFNQTGDQTGVADPMLGPLANNGGPTLTHALLAGSPANDAGDPNAIPGQNGLSVTDQRGEGFERLQNQRIDIGAVELQNNDPQFTSASEVNVEENTQLVHTLSAVDADLPAQSITFSIADSGADNDQFEIVSGNQLQFKAAPDSESPTDADGDNVYEVTVLADDGAGGVTPQAISVTVTGVNEHSPVFTSPSFTVVPENTTAVHTLSATDADLPAQSISFHILGGGADNDKFEIISGDQLQFIDPPDPENPTDSNSDNVYEVSVQADDGAGGVTPQAISVTVTGVNEHSPVFTSPTFTVIEENTTAVHTLSATDADLPAQSISFSIAGSGADNDKFEIVDGDQLQFIAPPDFGNPTDSDGDNYYEISVQADDGAGGVTSQFIEVRVQFVNSAAPVITSADSVSVATQEVLLVTATDADLPGGFVSLSIGNTGADDDKFRLLPTDDDTRGLLVFRELPEFENPGDADGDNVYEVTVEARDGDFTTQQTILVTLTGTPVATSEYVVDIATDELDGDFSAGDLSLREAMLLSGVDLSVQDTITFDASVFSSPQTISLADDRLPLIDGPVDIVGPGADLLTIDGSYWQPDGEGNGIFRVFHSGPNAVEISGLKITGGNNDAPGSAVANNGDLILSEVWIADNTTQPVNNSGNLTIMGSTISGNTTSQRGGALYNTGNVTITGSTITGNTATLGGGAIDNRGSLTLAYSTLTDNSATSAGGAIRNTGSLQVHNSIVAGNTSTGAANILNASGGNLTGNFNVLGAGAVTGGTSDITGVVDPLLGPLANNGGSVPTHILLAGSPAIDAGDPNAIAGVSGIPEFDQRGFARVQNSQLDVGAYEVQVAADADFDADNDVDGADFLAWQRGFGSTPTTRVKGDADGNNQVNAIDLSVWQQQYGQANTTLAAATSGQTAANRRQGVAESVPDSALSAELIDAAMALVSNYKRESEPRLPVAAPKFAEVQLATNIQSKSLGLLQPSSDPQLERVPDEESNSSRASEAWLSDELLELVFE